jgi:hypothetical protein
MGPKVTALVARNICMIYAGYMTHFVREFCAYHLHNIYVRFMPDARVTSVNTTQILRAPAAQQGMLRLDPSVYCSRGSVAT